MCNITLSDKEKYILDIRNTFTEKNQGKADAIIEELVLQKLIRNNKDNFAIKQNTKISYDEVNFIQAFRILDNEYKSILADRLYSLYSVELEVDPNLLKPNLLVIK